MFKAGGAGVLARRLAEAGRIVDTPTVTGRSLFAEADAARETPRLSR